MNRKGLRISAVTAIAGVAFGVAAPAATAAEAHHTQVRAAQTAAANLTPAQQLAAIHASANARTTGEAQMTAQELAELNKLANSPELQRASKLGSIINLLKKSPKLLSGAKKAAKAAWKASKNGKKKSSAALKKFNNWVNGLSNMNPVKWAIKATPNYVMWNLIDWLVNKI